MTARTLYALPGPLPLTPSQLGRSGRFKVTSRTLETVRAELWTDAGADVVEVTNPGDSVAFPLLGLRAVHLSASGYPAHVLLESTELPIALDCAPQISNTLANPVPVVGGSGGCLYVAPFDIPSPVDLLGGQINGSAVYVPRTPPWPVAGTVLSGAVTLYGTENGSGFGVNSVVALPAGVISAEWPFTLPAERHVCAAQLVAFGGPLGYVELLVDGVVVIAAGGFAFATGTAISPTAFGTVYTIRYTYTHPGGGYGGVDFNALLLWPLGL